MKRFVFLSLSILATLILVPSCVTVQAPVGTLPVIGTFVSNPSTVNSGATSTLLWNVTGATSVTLDQGIGQVDVAGTRVIQPAQSTVYTISATNSAGTVIKTSAIIFVSTPTQPPQTTGSYPAITFTASSLGGASWQLNWNVSNATLINIQPDIGPVGLTGSTSVTVPSGQTKMYRLEAVNDSGWAYRQVIMATP